MKAPLSEDDIRQMASRWLPSSHNLKRIRIITDTTDFFRVDYGDVVVLGDDSYLIRHNAKEGRFGIDDDVKFWVKRAIDLKTGNPKILKLVLLRKVYQPCRRHRLRVLSQPQKRGSDSGTGQRP